MSQMDAIKATFLILIHAIYVLYTYYTMHFNIITEDSEYFFVKVQSRAKKVWCLQPEGSPCNVGPPTRKILKTPTALKAQNILQPLK